jgi:hypothetical protein
MTSTPFTYSQKMGLVVPMSFQGLRLPDLRWNRRSARRKDEPGVCGERDMMEYTRVTSGLGEGLEGKIMHVPCPTRNSLQIPFDPFRTTHKVAEIKGGTLKMRGKVR